MMLNMLIILQSNEQIHKIFDILVKRKTRFLDLLSTEKKNLDCTVENDRLDFFSFLMKKIKQEKKEENIKSRKKEKQNSIDLDIYFSSFSLHILLQICFLSPSGSCTLMVIAINSSTMIINHIFRCMIRINVIDISWNCLLLSNSSR